LNNTVLVSLARFTFPAVSSRPFSPRAASVSASAAALVSALQEVACAAAGDRSAQPPVDAELAGSGSARADSAQAEQVRHDWVGD